MKQKDLKKKISKIEEEIASLKEKKKYIENEGCFSDEEVKSKKEKLKEVNAQIKMLFQEKEEIRKRLRLGKF